MRILIVEDEPTLCNQLERAITAAGHTVECASDGITAHHLGDVEDFDAVVLDLPFTPLCRDDCLGLCVTCGANLNDDPDHSHGEEIDARWAALIELDVDGEQN